MKNLWEGENDDTTVADETCEELFTVCVWKTLGLLFWLFSSVISFWRLKGKGDGGVERERGGAMGVVGWDGGWGYGG